MTVRLRPEFVEGVTALHDLWDSIGQRVPAAGRASYEVKLSTVLGMLHMIVFASDELLAVQATDLVLGTGDDQRPRNKHLATLYDLLTEELARRHAGLPDDAA